MDKNADLTICIPAFNNNASLERALNSIKNQTISKKIDVLISDDCSPNIINKTLLNKFNKYFKSFNLIRQHINLGVLSNAAWLFRNIRTNYYTFLQHDDVVYDENFYERALNSFIQNKKLVCYFGNSVLLNNDCNKVSNFSKFMKEAVPMYSLDNPDLVGLRYDNSMNGDDLILNLTNEKIEFNTSWSAVIFKKDTSLVCGGFGGGYTLSKWEASLLNIYREEEHFALLYFLCCIGECQLENKPSIIRILEPTSFSRSPTHPGILMTQDSYIFAMYKLASEIEQSFDTQKSEKIIRLIFKNISKYALKFENSLTKKFFDTYKLKNKKYGKLIADSLSQSRKIKSRFELFYLIKAYCRYYKNLFFEKFFKKKGSI